MAESKEDNWDDFFDEEVVEKKGEKKNDEDKPVSKVQEDTLPTIDKNVSEKHAEEKSKDWKKEPEKEIKKPEPEEKSGTGKVSEFDWGDEEKDTSLTTQPTTAITKPVVVTLDGIPKQFLIKLHGEDYIGAAGLVFIANRMGRPKIRTEAKLNSWENEKKIARYHAVVHLNGGIYEADGVAIPDGRNIKTPKMWPFADLLAETRAVNRALRRATNYGHPSAEEMADYEKADF